MTNIRKLSIILAICMVLTLLPVASANAEEGGSLWLRHVPGADGVSVYICADAPVASGLVTITYNADVLTFTELVVSEDFVLAHAVNNKEAGIIKISWIGTGAESEEAGYSLMELVFTGAPDQSEVMTGAAYDASGDTFAITTLNTTGVTAAIMEAETLQSEEYTAESFAVVQTALKKADELLNTVAVTQSQLDAAAQELVTAMENLVVYVPEPPPTDPAPTDPAPTDPAPTDPAPTQPKPTQPGSTPAKPQPTQPSTQAPNTASQPDNSWMLIVLAALGVVAALAAVVILKKRGSK